MRTIPDSPEGCFDELKALGYQVQRFSEVHWRIGRRVSFYPTRGSIVVDGQKREPERGFIALLQVLEREGIEGKPVPIKPKREEFSFSPPKNPECREYMKMARAIVSSPRLSPDERRWIADIIRLREAFELPTGISFKDEKRLIRLFRTATRILKKPVYPRRQIEVLDIETGEVMMKDSDS